jgi:hypothetical protein
MQLDRSYVIDIETNGLLSDMVDFRSFPYKLKDTAKLWCVCIRNVGTREVVSAVKEEITFEWMQEALKDCDYLIAHNGIKFDFIALKLFGVFDYEVGYLKQPDKLFGRDIKIIDTLVLSRLLYPDRFGGHSLEAWGERTGNPKTDYRAECIEAEYIDKKDPRGTEFLSYNPLMLPYCEQDTNVNVDTFFALNTEMGDYKGWLRAFKLESKLADLAVKRESLGFWFDKDLAVKCLEDLTEKMTTIENSINPILPPKKMGKTEQSKYILPKIQFKKDGSPSSALLNRVKALDGMLTQEGSKYQLLFGNQLFTLPYHEPLMTSAEATVKDLDHIKMFLMSLGWVPMEWRERDLTKDAKKQNLSFEKRLAALRRWVDETLAGKYRDARLNIIGCSAEDVYSVLEYKLHDNKPVRVPTSPSIRIGVEKELCPNLVGLGDKVSFANDFALYLTYKHRKSSIAGGEIEDMDFDEEAPNTGFLSVYREEDHRVPTPAIEIGAATFRYKHTKICNIARASSVYGKEMRSLFGCGPGAVQLGFDFSSLEARIMGHYVLKYKDGGELAESMLAEKPNDVHSLNAVKLGIARSEAKSLTYGILYGAQPAKVSKMLNVSLERAKEIYNDFWDAVPALKELKTNVENFWENNSKEFVPGVDGRKLRIRSKHSILNALFQSAGVICAKYVTVLNMEEFESMGYCTDPFVCKPDVCSMIEYHDECQYYVSPKLVKFETFDTEEEAEQFIKDWRGEEQLSAVSHGATKWYITLPNPVSTTIANSIRKTEKIVGLNVPLGFEFIVSNNWYGCH